MSLKTKDNPDGEFTEVQAYQMLMVLFMCVFENLDPEHGWFLRTTAKKIADELNAIIENSLEQVRPRHPISAFFARATMRITSGSDDLVDRRPCYSFLSRLAESGRPLKDLVATVMGLAVGSSVNYAQASAQIVDFYLDDARAKERADIVRLVAKPENDEEANERLIGYIKEAQRLAPQFPGLLRKSEAKEPVRVSQGSGKKDVVIQPGQLVYGSYYSAHTNVSLPPSLITRSSY
jgi:linoleate 10R-lipoxygenase